MLKCKYCGSENVVDAEGHVSFCKECRQVRVLKTKAVKAEFDSPALGTLVEVEESRKTSN